MRFIGHHSEEEDLKNFIRDFTSKQNKKAVLINGFTKEYEYDLIVWRVSF